MKPNLTNILRAINAVVLLACVVPSVSLSVYWKREAIKARKDTQEAVGIAHRCHQAEQTHLDLIRSAQEFADRCCRDRNELALQLAECQKGKKQ